MPHPFDRLHTVPGSTLLKANLTDVDVIEVFNSRIAYPGFNEKAVRFAERHRLPAAAGSDAHVLPASARRSPAWASSPAPTTSSRR